jgi:ATP-dependent RNA helicase RhlE
MQFRLAIPPLRGSSQAPRIFQESRPPEPVGSSCFPGRFQEIDIDISFKDLGLSPELLRAVAEQDYTVPTPIQAQAIPVVLAGRDLLAAAQTGTGKTAGFTLPMLQRLAAKANASTSANASASPARRPVRALVLAPTRELAAQVLESVRNYGKHLRLTSTVIFGGVGFGPQAEALRRGVDIVVATPGRLLDHVHERTIDLRHVEILVLDEADRMLDMGFLPDIRRVLAALPAKRQNLLFSATFPDPIRKLAASFMRHPATVETARRNAPIEAISQVVHPVDKERKRELLAHLVRSNDWNQVLVFTKTKHGANRLAEQLNREGLESDAIHGNKKQNARTRALKRFKDNELRVLVATDIAARGIDIDLLPHVVNYDLPNVPEDYVHRIGRTGRAGATGEALSLLSADDRPLLHAIEKLIQRKLEQRVIGGFEPSNAGGRREHRHQPQHQQHQPQHQQHQPQQQQRKSPAPKPGHSAQRPPQRVWPR